MYKKALKQLSKFDQPTKLLIKNWLDNNLVDVEDPRWSGKQLKGSLSKYWRYRIGQYRLIVEIIDEGLIIIAVEISHRKKVYQNLNK